VGTGSRELAKNVFQQSLDFRNVLLPQIAMSADTDDERNLAHTLALG
jgi:hypothetical protein